MVALKFLLGLIVLIFLVTFAVKNMEPQVTIDYYFGYSFGPVPFFFALLGSAVLGAIIAMFFALVEQLKLRSVVRRQNRQLASMEKEMMEFKQITPEPVPEPEPQPETEEDPDATVALEEKPSQ